MMLLVYSYSAFLVFL